MRSKVCRNIWRHHSVIDHLLLFPLPLLLVHHQQVYEQELIPGLSNQACNSITLTSSALSHEVTKLMIVCQVQVGCRLQKQKADAVRGYFLCNGTINKVGMGEGEEAKWQGHRQRSMVLWANFVEDKAILPLFRDRRCGGGRLFCGLIEVWKHEL